MMASEGLTRAELARKLGVSRAWVTKSLGFPRSQSGQDSTPALPYPPDAPKCRARAACRVSGSSKTS